MKVILKTGTTQDGEYDLDLDYGNFTTDEFAFMSEITGAYGLEIMDRFWKDDAPSIVAVAAVMMQRAGRIPDIQILRGAKRSAFTFDLRDLEKDGEEDGPPSPTPSDSGSPGETSNATESDT